MIDEGHIKFEARWRRSAPVRHPAVDELIRWRRPLYDAGLVGCYEDSGIGYGNLSARVEPPGLFFISGAGTGCIADAGPEHFALVTLYDVDANIVESEGAVAASSESMTHAAIYELDERFRAVIHVHDTALWAGLKDVLPATGAAIAYGTPEMAREFRRLYAETIFRDSGIAVMAGHAEGLVSVGGSVREAVERLLSVRDAFLLAGPGQAGGST